MSKFDQFLKEAENDELTDFETSEMEPENDELSDETEEVTYEEVLELAMKLSPEDQKKLADELEGDEEDGEEDGDGEEDDDEEDGDGELEENAFNRILKKYGISS